MDYAVTAIHHSHKEGVLVRLDDPHFTIKVDLL